MNIKYTITLFFIVVLSLKLFGQTKLIAHKSHSGSMEGFSINTVDNFGLGEPYISLQKAIKLEDGRVIIAKISGQLDWINKNVHSIDKTTFLKNVIEHNGTIDTLSQHPVWNNPNIGIDSLKVLYGNEIEYIGFDKAIKKTQKEVKRKKANAPLVLPPSSSNPNGNLPLLIIAISLLMIIMIFYNWRKKTQVLSMSYAQQ